MVLERNERNSGRNCRIVPEPRAIIRYPDILLYSYNIRADTYFGVTALVLIEKLFTQSSANQFLRFRDHSILFRQIAWLVIELVE